MFKRMFTAALVFGLAALAPPAFAQTVCAPRDAIAKQLEQGFQETYRGGGLQNATQLLEIWSSQETGSWTIVVTRADGVSCVVASGTYFFIKPETPKGEITG